MRSTDIRVLDVSVDTEAVPYRAPLKFGGRVVSHTDLLNVAVRVSTGDKREAVGRGSMPLGNVWSWPSDTVSEEQSAEATSRFACRLAEVATDTDVVGHPIEIVHQLSKSYDRIADGVVRSLDLAEPMPALAQLVAASPWDAALHDAYGRVLETNSYLLCSAEFVGHDLSRYLGSAFKDDSLDRYVLAKIKPRMPLYHLVGMLDPLTDADIEAPIGDNLPETLSDWIAADRLTHYKIKLQGDDLAWDIDRVTAIDRVVTESTVTGGSDCHYSLDFNEHCESVEYLLNFFRELRQNEPVAFHRIQYVEQPMHRDLHTHPDANMSAAGVLKPVVIDESLVDLDSMHLACELGYSGVALKACKGHSESLLIGAAAIKAGLFLCVQDLTCPGASFLHSASLAARLPGVSGVEGNARQYCPAANTGWSDRYPEVFQIRDGGIDTSGLTQVGLGFDTTPRQ